MPHVGRPVRSLRVIHAFVIGAWVLAVCACGAPSSPPVQALEADNPVRPMPDGPLGTGIVLQSLADPPTPPRVRLGRWLFFDRRLSSDATVACATCHQPEYGFAQRTPLATGVGGRKERRKVPPILNVSVVSRLNFRKTPRARFFWDGRATSLERQARGVARRREIAIRMAIGAGRRRVIRQLLVESLMLSAMGGLAGWWLARAGVDIYAAVANGSGISEETFGSWFIDVLDYSMDGRAFIYLAAISMITAIACGLVPALRLSKLDVGCGLKPGSRAMTADPRHRRASRLLVAVEMALAIVLVASAGMLVRGFLSVYLASPGFDASGVAIAQIALPRERRTDESALRGFLDRVLRLGANAPSVEQSATASALPGWSLPARAFDVDDERIDERTRPVTGVVTIGGEYFRALGVQPVEGRGFVAADQSTVPEAIVNRQFAARYLRGDALGRRIRFMDGNVPGPWLLIVGVAPDIAQSRAPNQRDPVVYVSARQQPTRGMWVLARSRSAAERLEEPLRAALLRLDPDLLIAYGPSPLSDRLALNYEYRAVVATVFTLFAVIAVLLAAFGLYGVMAFSVAERTQEIGIRAAIGGTMRQILAAIAADAVRPIATGLVGGIAVSVALGAVLRAEFAQVKPSDPAMLAAACVILVIAAGIGCVAPARRALRIDPMVATRQAD